MSRYAYPFTGDDSTLVFRQWREITMCKVSTIVDHRTDVLFSDVERERLA